MTQLVHHHVKYKEIHGVDEVVLMDKSEHYRLHKRLRDEGKCNIPVNKLAQISNDAWWRRVHPTYTRAERRCWRMFRGFERENEGRPLYETIVCG